MNAEQRRHLEQLRLTHERHLRVLELQAAKFQLNVPAYIVLEIEDIRNKLAEIDTQLGASTPEGAFATAIKIVLLASNPAGTPPLALDEEIRAISAKIRSAEYRTLLSLVPCLAARPDDLLQALNQHRPQIVHFSGHGSAAGEIILMDDNRQPRPVSATALRALFTTLRDQIRVVVLNACYSEIQAQAIAEIIDCVIGISGPLADQASVTWSAAFYRALAFGRSVQEAFDQGRVAVLLEGNHETDSFNLLARAGVDPASIFLIRASDSAR